MPDSPVVLPTPNEFSQRNGYRPFPPRWERWLSEVRNSIVAAQSMPGRNTSVDVHPGKGTVVNVAESRRGGGPTPPPVECHCPDGGCVHCIFFRVKIDSAEGSGPYFVYFIGQGVWADFDNNQWVFDGVESSVTIPFGGDPLGAWHDIQIVWNYDPGAGTVTAYFSVDGVQSDTMEDDASLYGEADKLQIGSLFPGEGGVAHHSIEQFVLCTNDLENFPSGVIFKFPDEFDFTEGTGISYDGTTLRVDNDSIETADFIKWFSYNPDFPSAPALPHVPMVCCCHVSELAAISTITLEASVFTVNACPDSGCYQIGRTLSKTWTRTSAPGIPGPSQFKLNCTNEPFTSSRSIRFLAGIQFFDGSTSFSTDALLIEEGTNGMSCCNNDDGNLMPELDTTQAQIGVAIGPNFPGSDAGCDQIGLTPSIPACGGFCIPNESIPEWDSGTEYSMGQRVRSGLYVYESDVDHNIGHTPFAPFSDGWWTRIATQCGESTGTDVPEDIFDLADIAGTHTWSNSWTSAGGVDWEVTWTLTIS